jgi:hypothetical protein
MKIILSASETLRIFDESYSGKSITVQKSMLTKWIKQSEEHRKDLVNAVDNCKGWLLGERYSIADIFREDQIIERLKNRREKLNHEINKS